ncbi:MAG: hypothetical protein DMG61_19875 [Acidobacteria bacterium]|nr:MAG: hypothetical protein DMG61_19875 [Acidobacteriota bacterium]
MKDISVSLANERSMNTSQAARFQAADQGQPKVPHLVSLAVRGLVAMFDSRRQLFCYKLKKCGSKLVQEGISHRYTMMTLLGLHRLEMGGGTSSIKSGPVFDALISNLDWVDNIGDLGVLLWLCGVVSPERLSVIESQLDVKTALTRYQDARQRRTMELSWFLTGLSYLAMSDAKKSADLKDVAFRTYDLVKKNRGITFFGHQARGASLVGTLRGQIGSFADQVYPIYAMTQFFKAYDRAEAKTFAMESAAGICTAQGPLGQWWWHYNSAKGQVAEGYPVFSVHQHAMAPMTLFALGETVHQDFTPWIYKGLEWINSQNELNFDMEDDASNLVWRCIFRSRISSSSRYLKARFGSHSPVVQHDRREDLSVLYECRPYELGWLLYAFAARNGNECSRRDNPPEIKSAPKSNSSTKAEHSQQKPKYVLMTAAYNEAAYIQQTLDSIVSQTIRPERWVIVSDSSKDGTDEIVQSYARRYDFIRFLRISRPPGRNFHSKVMALHKGATLLEDATYDYIGNVDADISLDASYFERLIEKFQVRPGLGLTAGYVYEGDNKEFRVRRSNRIHQVCHAAQLVRRECYEAINGYAVLRYGGEDWYAQTSARMKGWDAEPVPELRIFHHRSTGGADGQLRSCLRCGKLDYSMGTDPLFELVKCARRITSSPFLIGALARLAGFVWLYLSREPKEASPELCAFLRKEQRQRFFAFLKPTSQQATALLERR